MADVEDRDGETPADTGMAPPPLADILERITDAFVSLDTEWRYTYVNRKAAQVLGRRAEDLIGRNIWMEFPEGVGQPFYHAYHKAVAEQTPLQIEEYYPPFDRWLENRIFPGPHGLSIFFQDITERKLAEARAAEQSRAIEAQRLWLEAVLDRMPVPLVFIEPQTAGVTFANRAADALAGGAIPRVGLNEAGGVAFRVTDAGGRTLPVEDLPRARVARGERLEMEETFWQTPAGARVLVVSGDLLPALHGHDPLGLLVFQDISARKDAERRLAESEQRYKSLFDYNTDAVFSFDRAGTFLSANAACQTVSGHAPEELLGTRFAPLIVPEDRTHMIARFARAAGGEPQAFETTVTHKTGRWVPLAVTIMPTVVDGAIVGVFGIAKDISERRRTEEAVREANARQRGLLRDVLSSVTEGKLQLRDDVSDLPPPLAPFGEPIPLTAERGLRELRGRAWDAAREAGHSEERRHDLVTAVSEAGMNAVVHGGGRGAARLSVDGGTVQARVEDEGAGIDMEQLPRAALARGFSTKATLGHGLKMMIDMTDRLFLSTGPGGTVVVLEQEPTPALPEWLR